VRGLHALCHDRCRAAASAARRWRATRRNLAALLVDWTDANVEELLGVLTAPPSRRGLIVVIGENAGQRDHFRRLARGSDTPSASDVRGHARPEDVPAAVAAETACVLALPGSAATASSLLAGVRLYLPAARVLVVTADDALLALRLFRGAPATSSARRLVRRSGCA